MVEEIVLHSPILLRPDPARVVIRPFAPAEDDPEFATADCTRAQRIANRILAIRTLLLPYEIADKVTTFATVGLGPLLSAAMA